MSAIHSPDGASPRALNDANRRQVAIGCADVAGYTRLMQADEDDTHRRMMDLQSQVIAPQIEAGHGKLIKYTGDGFFATFDKAEDATRFAVTLQQRLIVAEHDESPSRRIAFRMAINVADVIFEANDIFGDGVNTAARLQTYAEPGGIVVSDAVTKQIGTLDELEFVDLGHLPLRNIARPVRAFGLHNPALPMPLLGEALPGSEGPPSIVVLPFREHHT